MVLRQLRGETNHMKLEALRRQVGEQNLSKTLGMDPLSGRGSMPNVLL